MRDIKAQPRTEDAEKLLLLLLLLLAVEINNPQDGQLDHQPRTHRLHLGELLGVTFGGIHLANHGGSANPRGALGRVAHLSKKSSKLIINLC